MIIKQRWVDIETPTGLMRVYIYEPAQEGVYPGLIFYSEIFQRTEPISRAAAVMAGHGFVVLVPEVFHELNPIGTVLGYDDVGKDKGNSDKFIKLLEHHDSDTAAMLDYLSSQANYSGKAGAMGVCIGGHLAFRAALSSKILAASCLYPTDLHSDTLPSLGANTLARAGEVSGELMLVFGRQDPHVPVEGRQKIYAELSQKEVNFSWSEFNAQHAFMRDEGERYDPELAQLVYRMSVDLFRRTLN